MKLPFKWCNVKGPLLIIFAALVFLWLIKAPVIASYLTRVMKVPVSIGLVSIWPTETSIRSFKIVNPRKFKSHKALVAKKTQIEYEWRKLIQKDRCEIDRITVDGVFITVEFSKKGGGANNWTAISDRMPKARKEGRDIVIDELLIRDITVEIRGPKGELRDRRHIDQLRFTNISSNRGFPTGQLIRQLFQGAGIQGLIQDAFQEPAQLIRKFFNPFSWILDDVEKTPVSSEEEQG